MGTTLGNLLNALVNLFDNLVNDRQSLLHIQPERQQRHKQHA